jgi:hypothetical protein
VILIILVQSQVRVEFIIGLDRVKVKAKPGEWNNIMGSSLLLT